MAKENSAVEDFYLYPLVKSAEYMLIKKLCFSRQDNAPCHGAKSAQTLSARKRPHFTRKYGLPPNNPEIIPDAYCLRCTLKGSYSKCEIVCSLHLQKT